MKVPDGYSQVLFGRCQLGDRYLDPVLIEEGKAKFPLCTIVIGQPVENFILVIRPRKGKVATYAQRSA